MKTAYIDIYTDKVAITLSANGQPRQYVKQECLNVGTINDLIECGWNIKETIHKEPYMKEAKIIYSNGVVMPYQCEGRTNIDTIVHDARKNMPKGADSFQIEIGQAKTTKISK